MLVQVEKLAALPQGKVIYGADVPASQAEDSRMICDFFSQFGPCLFPLPQTPPTVSAETLQAGLGGGHPSTLAVRLHLRLLQMFEPSVTPTDLTWPDVLRDVLEQVCAAHWPAGYSSWMDACSGHAAKFGTVLCAFWSR